MKLNLLFTATVVIAFLFNQSLFANFNHAYNCRQNDSLNLVAFYNKIEAGLTWDLTKPIDTWAGITLKTNGCVSTLNLSSLSLSGTIAPEIGLLQELYTLDLSENFLSGEIPAAIGKLQSLSYLSLANNDISGDIPEEIGNLSELEYLSLEKNALTGNIPQSLISLQKLSHLSFAANYLTGSIPSQIGNLSSLSYFNLCENDLTGHIPSSLGNLDNLDELYLFSNNFEGCFYEELKNLCGINSISFVDDDDEGNSFDASWYSFCEYDEGICNPYSPCRQKDSLSLVTFYNSIEGLNWDLTQPINTWKGVSLNGNGCVSSINLNSQSLTGAIPHQIGAFNNLDTLNLSNNNFSGAIPITIGNLNSLNYLSLSKNNLTGSIPKEIGYLSDLSYLSLNKNSLTGAIPTSLSNLFNIKHLSLAGNELSGSIPADFGYLYSLGYLNLCENELTGTIPKSFTNLYSLDTLYLYNNYFEGCFFKELKSLCEANSIGLVSDDDDDDDGDTNVFDTSWYSFCEYGEGICDSYSPCRQQDSLTLVAFYNNIEGNLNWDLTKPIDEWYGVELNGYGCVEKLNLSFRVLKGNIPTELSKLNNLKELNLRGNALTGSIPTELNELSKLIRLDVSYNNLTGNIPPGLGKLTNLTDLYLNDNDLIGEIPVELFELKNLYNNCNSRGLKLSDNNLGNCFSYLLLPYCDKMPCNNTFANNNFDATWDEFCNFYAGTCCTERAENIIWENGNYVLKDNLYEAKNTIEMGMGAFIVVPEEKNATLVAGKHILLNGNFYLDKQANLILAIDSCR